MNKNNVADAFEMLLEEIETFVRGLEAEGAEAFRAGDHDRAGRLADDARRVSEFRDKARSLQKEWQSILAGKAPRRKRGRKRYLGKLPRGRRTPEQAFRRPILEALVELGGSAPKKKVLDVVGKKMRGVLKADDQERLSSPPHEKRWRNSAAWCRHSMVREGLLRGDSPRGVWEITPRGRRALEKGQA